MGLRINQINPKRESTKFPPFPHIRTTIESGIDSSGRQSIGWKTVGAEEHEMFPFLVQGTLAIMLHIVFCLLAPWSYPLKSAFRPRQITTTCALEMQLIFLIFCKMFPAFYFPLGSSTCPRLSCLTSLELTFHKHKRIKTTKENTYYYLYKLP